MRGASETLGEVDVETKKMCDESRGRGRGSGQDERRKITGEWRQKLANSENADIQIYKTKLVPSRGGEM